MAAERERCEDTDLAAGVGAFDIGGRIAFGIAELLRCFQGFVKGRVVLCHLGKDIICRTVENAGNAVQLICGKTLVHGPDNRDAAADACLEQEFYAVLRRQLQKLRAAGRNELLV